MKSFELHPHNRSAALNPKLFRRPTAEYRGAPFWSWNTKLDRAQLLRQLDYLSEMGMGGAMIHCRTGLATEYLGDEFMELVRVCLDRAKRRKMLLWLYDEDRWPSGFAGGLVTKDSAHRAKYLLWTCRPYSSGATEAAYGAYAGANRAENGTLLAAFDVELNDDGCLKQYRHVPPTAPAATATGVRRWYAYLETATPTSWFNNQTYVDTLSRAAIERFIQITHERYRQVLGPEFGRMVPAIFTDEPQFTHKQTFRCATDTHHVVIPGTSGFGEDLLDSLPEPFWELSDDRTSVASYRYHDQLADQFAAACADTGVVGVGNTLHRADGPHNG